MRAPSRQNLARPIAAAALIALVSGAVFAKSLEIPEGQVFSVTDSSNTYFPIELPEGFFGELDGVPSDAVSETVQLEGVALGIDGIASRLDVKHTFHSAGAHNHSNNVITTELPQADTIISHGAAVLADMDSSARVVLRMEALALKSVKPVQVTYGGEASYAFEMAVRADGEQGDGYLVLNRDSEWSGIYDSSFPITVTASFANLDPDGPQATDAPQTTVVFAGSDRFDFAPPDEGEGDPGEGEDPGEGKPLPWKWILVILVILVIVLWLMKRRSG